MLLLLCARCLAGDRHAYAYASAVNVAGSRPPLFPVVRLLLWFITCFWRSLQRTSNFSKKVSSISSSSISSSCHDLLPGRVVA